LKGKGIGNVRNSIKRIRYSKEKEENEEKIEGGFGEM
jgi:hypothetical protein